MESIKASYLFDFMERHDHKLGQLDRDLL